MSRVYSDTVLPEDSGVSQDLNLGASGDNVTIPAGATLKTNKIADAGGNNVITSDGSGNLTVNAGMSGDFSLLTTNTFSGGSSSAFTTLIDSTYRLYKFVFIEVNPATNNVQFTFNGSIDGGSNYNVINTTTFFNTYRNMDGADGAMEYVAAGDLANGSGYQELCRNVGSEADESVSGELFLFRPSSTTFVTQFFATTWEVNQGNYIQGHYIGGYFNSTSAINALDFKMDSGNMDGTIKMYGVG